MKRAHFAVVATFLLSSTAFAQLLITSVKNAYSNDTRLSPGVLAEVYFSGATFPNGPISMSITVGGIAAQITGSHADKDPRGPAIQVVVPRELATGSTNVVMTLERANSPAYPIVLDRYAPALVLPFNDCRNETPIVILNVVGLGASVPATGSYSPYVAGMFWGIAAPVSVTIAAIPAEIESSHACPWLGVYGVNVRIPVDAPDGIQPLVLSVAGVKSNVVNVLVGPENRLATDNYSKNFPDFLNVSPGSLVRAKTCGMTLDGRTVRITDSAGNERVAEIVSASGAEITYVVPPATATGWGSVTVKSSCGVPSTVPLKIETVEPGLFVGPVSWNWFTPAPAGYLVRVHNGAQTIEALPAQPIDFGPETDVLYLVLFATGVRNYSSLANLRVIFGSQEGRVTFVGPHSQYPGVDQVNVLLPRSLAGHLDHLGELNDQVTSVQLRVDGKLSNTGYLLFP